LLPASRTQKRELWGKQGAGGFSNPWLIKQNVWNASNAGSYVLKVLLNEIRMIPSALITYTVKVVEFVPMNAG
jgi:hypothetical protein